MTNEKGHSLNVKIEKFPPQLNQEELHELNMDRDLRTIDPEDVYFYEGVIKRVDEISSKEFTIYVYIVRNFLTKKDARCSVTEEGELTTFNIVLEDSNKNYNAIKEYILSSDGTPCIYRLLDKTVLIAEYYHESLPIQPYPNQVLLKPETRLRMQLVK